MTRIRTATEIVLGLIEFLRNAQPLLDTKPGTAARDVCIDGLSTQVARVYEELRAVSNLQSLRLAIGADLDKLALNYGATRRSGSKSTGPALLTFNELATDIPINQGGLVFAKNGASYSVLNSKLVEVVNASTYSATATKYRSDLDLVGISDTYAIEVVLEASSPGVEGNISKYSLTSTNIPGILNVTNAFAFAGGRDSEDDATFRNRIFALFGGANTGTEYGYKNAALSDKAVTDALVIVAGDPLMTRDGTQVSIAEDGTRTIVSEGTGGKVDIIVYGTRLQETTSSVVYQDLSNTGDPTHPDNDFVLGQISEDEGKTVTRKRLDNLEDEILPEQPVSSIIEVSGSLSGTNFVEKSVDEWGRITGNYELSVDTGVYGGSPWGYDKLKWISDRISDYGEDKTKGVFNGQDPLSYTDLLEVGSIQQNISVTDENSTVSQSDRSSIQLKHYPVTSVTRVFNVTTGERYVVSSQNPDGSGTTNETGRITISGQTLPAVSDVLQVDYTWIFSYDPYFDFDNRLLGDNIRTVSDSIDWGYSNIVRRERATLISSGSYLTATTTHSISSVVSVNAYTEESAAVTLTSGRLSLVVSAEVSNVVSVVRASDGAELWDTSNDDGTISSYTIFLPTDTIGVFGDSVTVVYNASDVYNASSQGNFSGNVISVVPTTTATAGRIVECNYIANVNTVLPSTLLSSLPAIRSENAFDTEVKAGVGTQPTTHVFDSGGLIQSNIRIAPTNLALTISGTISQGTITVSGTTIYAVSDYVFTAAYNGLQQDLSSAIRSYLGLSSATSIPSNVSVARIVSVEKVTVTDDDVVTSSDQTYDIKGYSLASNDFVKTECIEDTSLSRFEFKLPTTSTNASNAPEVGDKLRVRFYIIKTSDSEDVSFSRSGIQYTHKKYLLVDTLSKSSGFTSTSSSSATLTATCVNQPATRARYKSYYDYTAPKSNERITVRFNYDKLITDVTLNVEDNRPVNADVLVKSALPVLVDVTMYIVVTSSFENSPDIVKQNVQDEVTSELNAQSLGTTIDQSDLIAAAYTVNGIDRARITYFNENGENGSVLSISAQKNEYIVANTVTVEVETR
jgi:uncharacterized phage protein gp47/JayE